MDENRKETQNLTSLVITILVIAVILLLGIMGYAYYTKDIIPKNKIVKLFSSEKITFNDLPQFEQDKYVSRSNPLEVLEPIENEISEIAQDIVEETPIAIEDVPNKFLEKMAKMQKDTDEMVTEEKNTTNIEIEDKPKNKFLEKMAKMQKETDEMILEQNGEQKEQAESKAQQLLKKTAKMQKETDDMIIRSNVN